MALPQRDISIPSFGVIALGIAGHCACLGSSLATSPVPLQTRFHVGASCRRCYVTRRLPDAPR